MRSSPSLAVASSLVLVLLAHAACSDEEERANVGTGGSSAIAGAGGSSAGSAGTAGKGGSAGVAGKGGQAGMDAGAPDVDPDAPPAKRFCELPGFAPTALKVPAGFCIRPFTDPAKTAIKVPRVIRFAPNGDLFVAAPAASTPGGAAGGLGAIFVVTDDDHDGRADQVLTYAGGKPWDGKDCYLGDADPTDFSCVHGIAFVDGDLYYTRWNDVRRFPYKAGDRKAPSAGGEIVATLNMPTDSPGNYRFTHTLDKAKDGTMYVSRGRFDTFNCNTAEMVQGAVQAFPYGPGVKLPNAATMIADGFRNPMYMRCNQAKGLCFADEMSGDNWDGVGGREKIALLTPGSHWGFPCCVTKGKAAPGATDDMCNDVSVESVAIELHDSPFGLDFEPGAWPADTKGAIFIAKHGVVGSWVDSDVVYVPTTPDGMPAGGEQPFTSGFGKGAGTVNGRATDVAFAPDGRLFVVDDTSGMIWWIAPEELPIPGAM